MSRGVSPPRGAVPLNFAIFYREHCATLAWVVTYSFVLGVLCSWTSVWLRLWNQFPHFYVAMAMFAAIGLATIYVAGRLEVNTRLADRKMAALLRTESLGDLEEADARRPPAPRPSTATTARSSSS